MIFKRSLQRELAVTALAVFMVLLTVMLAAMLIRVLGFAVSGQIDPRDVLRLIGLTLIGYLAVMLIVTLFASILFVLARWCHDSEMAVWLSCGVNLWQFIQPVAVFSAPLIAAIAFFAFVGWPWARAQSKLLEESFAQRNEASLLAPGQFRESLSNHHVFFIEQLSADAQQVRNIFVASTAPGEVSIIVAAQAYLETRPPGERFIVLENGRRYDGQPGQADYRIMAFERYGMRLETQRLVDKPTTASTSTRDLIRAPTPPNLAELAWRAGLPMIAVNLMLLAIPLAHQQPQRSRMLNLAMAVLIYLTYSNLLSLSQSWIRQQKLSFGIGLWGLHAIVLAMTALLFWLRVRNRPLFSLVRR